MATGITIILVFVTFIIYLLVGATYITPDQLDSLEQGNKRLERDLEKMDDRLKQIDAIHERYLKILAIRAKKMNKWELAKAFFSLDGLKHISGS